MPVMGDPGERTELELDAGWGEFFRYRITDLDPVQQAQAAR